MITMGSVIIRHIYIVQFTRYKYDFYLKGGNVQMMKILPTLILQLNSLAIPRVLTLPRVKHKD